MATKICLTDIENYLIHITLTLKKSIGDIGWHGIDGSDGLKGVKGERGYTFPYELAPRGEPGFDGIPGLKGEQGS